MSANYTVKLLSLKSVAMGNNKYTNFITKTAVDAELDTMISLFCQRGRYQQADYSLERFETVWKRGEMY